MNRSVKNTYVAPSARNYSLEGLHTICQGSMGGIFQGDLIPDPDPIDVTPMDITPIDIAPIDITPII